MVCHFAQFRQSFLSPPTSTSIHIWCHILATTFRVIRYLLVAFWSFLGLQTFPRRLTPIFNMFRRLHVCLRRVTHSTVLHEVDTAFVFRSKLQDFLCVFMELLRACGVCCKCPRIRKVVNSNRWKYVRIALFMDICVATPVKF